MKLILLFINLISYFCRIFELDIPIILLNFMKAKHLLLLVSMLILSMGGGTLLIAQDRIVSGVVADEIGPIYGAAVQVAGTTHGTTTDADGKFSISVSEGASLLFSCLGYESQQIPVEGRDEINVVLKEDSHLLEMATVIGYGSGSKIGTTIGSREQAYCQCRRCAAGKSRRSAGLYRFRRAFGFFVDKAAQCRIYFCRNGTADST